MALAQGRSLPPAWTLVTPYCKRTRPGRGANTKAAGSTSHACLPPAALSPLRVLPRADPSGLGHAAMIYSSVQGPPGFRNTDNYRPPLPPPARPLETPPRFQQQSARLRKPPRESAANPASFTPSPADSGSRSRYSGLGSGAVR
jgi:hypothetical protein